MKKNFGLLSIGGFLFYSFMSLFLTFEELAKYLVIIKVDPKYNVWIAQLLQSVVFLGLFYLSYSIIKNKLSEISNNITKYLFISIGLYFFAQVIQMLVSYYVLPELRKDNSDQFEIYNQYFLQDYNGLIVYVSHYLNILFLFIIFYFIYKRIPNPHN